MDVMRGRDIVQSYEGEWHTNKMCGEGKCTWYSADGRKRAVYRGGFQNGVREGYGMLEYFDGIYSPLHAFLDHGSSMVTQ